MPSMSTFRQKKGRPAYRPRRAAALKSHDQHSSSPMADGERLQKVMAAAGVGSRRHCEELILAGRVEVDRRVLRKLGTRVDADKQEIRVDGELLKAQRRSYYLVNKPIGVVSTNFDPSGRPRVIDLLPPTNERLFTVGRLDLSSEGLMLVTNDGELANRLAHPRYGVEKTYHALVAGKPEAEVLESLRRGVQLAEGVARVVSVKVKKEIKQSTLLEIVLAEGRNREIRRILAKVGHKVLRLKRVAIGPLRLKDLEPGQWRPLAREEVDSLRGRARPAERTHGRLKKKRSKPFAQRQRGEQLKSVHNERRPRRGKHRFEKPRSGKER
jgi:23S rRNA pseudouridine2605 synthase